MKCGDNGHTNSNGTPCKRDVRPGFTACNLHGGENKAAKIKAEQMLAQSRIPACEALYTILDKWQSNTCATCGHPHGGTEEDRTIIAAAKVILDRTGMGPHSTVDIRNGQTETDLDLGRMTTEEIGELSALVAQLNDLKTRVARRIDMVLKGVDATVDPTVTIQ